jgi:uncharacterized ion transporter superfamily protein YfcC
MIVNDNEEMILLKSILLLELIVQVVEGTFYVWMAYLFSSIKNVTPKRYLDWVITTPLMLFSLCMYLDYLKEKEEEDKKEKKDNEKKDSFVNYTLEPIIDAFSKDKEILIPIFLLNWLMLLFGYLGEIGVINNLIAVACRFIPFIIYYVMIYNHYAKYTTFGKKMFWYFAGVWSLYGVAAIMPYYWKNISYNILDIFSKNFFGLYLAYVIWKK